MKKNNSKPFRRPKPTNKNKWQFMKIELIITVNFFISFLFLPLIIDPLSSWRIPTVVNSPHLLSPICINIPPSQEQKENGEPPERMLFLRENPKDKLELFIEEANKREPYVGNRMAPERKAVPQRRVGTALRCPSTMSTLFSLFWESTLGTTCVGHPIAPELRFC